MTRCALALAALLLAAAAPPPGGANCSGCHGGGFGGGVQVNGRPTDQLAATMLAYRSGDRPSTIMGRLMKGLDPDQINAIAAWMSVQKR